MSYIEVHPKSNIAQQRMMDVSEELIALIRLSVKESFEVPQHDIIVELHQCSVVKIDPQALKANAAPDVVVKIYTNDQHLKAKAPQLSELLVERWKETVGDKLTVECWITFFDTWGCSMDFD